jgi:hypothetical protein
MNQPDHEFAKAIVEHLDYGADQLGPLTRERLLAARKTALSHYQVQSVAAWVPAWAGQAVARIAEYRSLKAGSLVVVAALVATFAGAIAWQTMNSGNGSDVADIDVGLLTDDLPINAYLDKGFDSWLKRSLR